MTRSATVPNPARRAGSGGVVLRAVLDDGPIARSTVARRTGLSPATVSTASTDLVECGLIRELPEVAGPTGLGRPHVPIDLDTGRFLVAGIHLAYTHTTVALLNVRGEVEARARLAHTGDPAAVLDRAAVQLLALAADRGGARLLGVGFAAGGWVDSASGTIVDHPLPGWAGVRVRDELERRTGLAVRIDSHARALIEAERLFGERRTRDSVALLFVGNVVDAAFATGDDVHQGPRAAAGAIAHQPVDSDVVCGCGRVGCFEATLSDRAVLREAMLRGIVDRPVFDDLLRLALAEHGPARELLIHRAFQVGRAVARLADLLDPEVVVVCERGVNQVPGCLDAARAGFAASSSVPRSTAEILVASSFPGLSLPVSAGAVILGELYRYPVATVRELAGASV